MNKTNKFENILIVSDFDGTFSGKDGRILDENCNAIKHFISNGGRFTFASGRAPTKMKELFPKFKELVNTPMIMVNGEMLYDPESDKILFEAPLDAKNAFSAARDILSKFPELEIVITDGEIFTSSNLPPHNVEGNWRMMTPHGEADVISKCYEYVISTYSSSFTIRRPSPHLIDMTNLGVNKGTAITRLREHLKAKGSEDIKIYCVGDYDNDTDMLLLADRAFCPSNALEHIKNICSIVLCDHDDGAIADLINKIDNNEI